MIISAIRAGIAYAAGQGAAKTVEHPQGISKNIIEEHAESALISLIDLFAVGVISTAGLFFNVEKPFFVQAVYIDRIICFLNRIWPCRKNRLPGLTDQAYKDLNQRGVIGERRECKDNDGYKRAINFFTKYYYYKVNAITLSSYLKQYIFPIIRLFQLE